MLRELHRKPYPRRSFLGYRLLQEYFAFPEKFFFMSLKGLSQLQHAGFTSNAELLFMISPFEQDGRQQRPYATPYAGAVLSDAG